MLYDDGLALLNEPAEVKAALPLAYVLEQAGVRLYAGENRLQGICPFHDDHTPSLDVYKWGEAERFGCFACGVSGDIFDLIRLLWPMSFPAAVETAKRALNKMQAEGWIAPALSSAPVWDVTAAAELLMRARHTGATGRQELDKFIAAKDYPFTAEWLQFRWGVATLREEVLVPYWTSTNELVAIKHRPSGGTRPLISLPGAQLKGTLYGEWKHQIYEEGNNSPVILCEGESDAWVADFHFGQTHEVLGIPTGAGAHPFWSDIFDSRRILIAFDGDESGYLGGQRWLDMFQSYYVDPSVLLIPPGYDVASLPAGVLKGLVVN